MKKFTLILTIVATVCMIAAAADFSPEYKKAVKAYNSAYYDSALEQFKAIVASDPTDGYSWAYIARIEQYNKQNDEAIAADRKALDYVPETDSLFRASLLENIAFSYRGKGDTATALTYLDRAIKLAPTYYDYRYSRAHWYMMASNYAKAESDYRYLSQADTLNADGWMGLGSVLDYQGKPQEALLAYDQAVMRFPNDDGAVSYRAGQYFNLHNYDAAMTDAIRSLELRHDNKHALWIIKNIYANDSTIVTKKLEAKRDSDPANGRFWQSIIEQAKP